MQQRSTFTNQLLQSNLFLYLRHHWIRPGYVSVQTPETRKNVNQPERGADKLIWIERQQCPQIHQACSLRRQYQRNSR